MNKKSGSKKSMDFSSRQKRIILESCIIKFMRISSVMYNNGLVNPCPDQIDAIDPFDLMKCFDKLRLSLENIHIVLMKEEINYAGNSQHEIRQVCNKSRNKVYGKTR